MVVRLLFVFGSFGLALVAAPAVADSAAQPIRSDVFEAAGLSRQVIIGRAAICMAKLLRPEPSDAEIIVAKDADAGIVVARNRFQYAGIAGDLTGRSEVTLEAKDGRFRITHDRIATFALGAWRPSPPSDYMRAELRGQANAIAGCIQTGPVADDF